MLNRLKEEKFQKIDWFYTGSGLNVMCTILEDILFPDEDETFKKLVPKTYIIYEAPSIEDRNFIVKRHNKRLILTNMLLRKNNTKETKSEGILYGSQKDTGHIQAGIPTLNEHPGFNRVGFSGSDA